MKEIGIEKLIELLNEYSKNIGYFNEEDLQGQTKAWILSKEFGFIKWLVSNEQRRIDRSKVNFENIFYEYDGDITYEERILILLSIQEEPVSFLISILK